VKYVRGAIVFALALSTLIGCAPVTEPTPSAEGPVASPALSPPPVALAPPPSPVALAPPSPPVASSGTRSKRKQALRLKGSGRASVNLQPAPAPFPMFPWPPPPSSATVDLPKHLFSAASTFGGISDRLLRALASTGCDEHAFFAVPDGFALVTRLSHIDEDGNPFPPPCGSDFNIAPSMRNLVSFFRGMFRAPEGYFRIIVFIVTDARFARSENRISRDQALEWLNKGFNALPGRVATTPATDQTVTTALIYEFKAVGYDKNAKLLLPSRLSAQAHLQSSGLWSALQK
jgi:hypothetical protein